METKRQPAVFRFDEKPHIMVIEARHYDDLADMLLDGAKSVLNRAGATCDVHAVPGSLEIPAAIVYAMRSLNYDAARRRYDGYVALGCVIRGSTIHHEVIAYESARSLQDLANSHALAIGNGILTCDTREQALARADKAQLDRGGAAAEACLRMIELKQKFHLSPKRRWVAR